MATQAAVLAGFTTTCLIEISIPDNANLIAKHFLHISAIVSICANITCVSLSTITNIWGSGKALRGKDGSMDEAVEGINSERGLIFKAFALGLAGNLSTVLSACFITMEYPTSLVASCVVLFTAWMIYNNANRIQKKFQLVEAVRLDDLTSYPNSFSAAEKQQIIERNDAFLANSNSNMHIGANGNSRNRKSALDIV